MIMSTLEFDTKFNVLTDSLNAFAYNLTKNTEDARDLYQETAIRAITNRDKFRPDTNFKAWIFTIMKNIFINNYRKKVKSNTIIDSTDNLYFLNSGSTLIENDAYRNILMDELNGMIDSLEDNIRVPFVMHYEGYKYQEIADEFSLPLGTVKSRIFFARKALKEYGLIPDYMPSTYYGKEMAQGLIKRSQKSENFLLMGGKVLSEDLPKDLQESGRRFHHVAVYETLFADAGVATQTIEEADFITFSSGSTVEGFVQSYPNLDYSRLHCIAIGETTATKARQFGFQVEVADQATVAKMRDKIKELVRHED